MNRKVIVNWITSEEKRTLWKKWTEDPVVNGGRKEDAVDQKQQK